MTYVSYHHHSHIIVINVDIIIINQLTYIVGMAVGKSILKKKTNNCIAVIGDGAITGTHFINNCRFVTVNFIVLAPTTLY